MRRQVATAGPGISLFPFLAVLLCTMGALIVVLVVLNRQSRLKAVASSAADRQMQRAALAAVQTGAAERRDALSWQIEHLRVSREKTQADLDRERRRLSGVEEHRRQLESRLRDLQRTAATLADVQSTSSDRPDLAANLAKLQAEIQSAQQRLAEVGQNAAGRATAYSVVPYDGAHRTRRRPIYIECLGDRVVIQPEGIVLSAADFDGPMGPGNPLASAIRAARDHLAATAPDPKSPEAEPYPLFLVRPDGIQAYYAARAAMQSWGSDFGYQTIDQDWHLEYPPVDGRLAQLERQAVNEARERLRWLVQMSPARYGPGGERRGSGNKVAYRVSPLGGLVREGGPTLRDELPGMANGAERQTGSFGSGLAESNGSRSTKSNGRLAAHPASGSSHVGEPAAADSLGQSSHADENLRDSRSGLANVGPSASADSPTTLGERRSALATGDLSNHSTPSAKTTIERRYGDLNDRRPANAAGQSPLAFDVTSSAATDQETGQSEAQMSFQPKPKDKPRSLADTRGANWGLSPAARSSNPITRPIHIVCEGDKLLIRPDRPDAAPVSIPLQKRTADSVDPLVAAVQARIADWGIAGRGLYWRPQLIVEVGNSGEARYADIESLLADSGFDVKRR